MDALCRDCTFLGTASGRCPLCHSPRLVAHPELADLSIAHLDCDAFYAAVEKRDNPDLADRPVIVGGGQRGVVAAACYVARRYGVRSAMAMYKAREACPHAVVLKPDMAKYREAGREVRALMRGATPLVQPLSIDEAFLDLSGSPVPAAAVADLVRRIEETVGVTVSVGLSYNKFLAKIASDMDKPRGFTVIGRAEARTFLTDKPVSLIWGVGTATQRRLRAEGVFTVGDLARWNEERLVALFGKLGHRLHAFARGEDDRQVEPDGDTKSISAETTFEHDRDSREALAGALEALAATVARRLEQAGLAGGTVTLKLKTADFRTFTRSRTLPHATQRADRLLEEGHRLLANEADGRSFRLIGLGVAELTPAQAGDPPDLFAGPSRTP